MSLPRYPEYKDSGVACFGLVPRHWRVQRLRTLGVFSASGIDKKSVEGELPVKMLNYVDVYNSRDKVLNFSENLMDTTAPRDKVLEHSVVRGDILITPSSETSDDIGHAARVVEMPDNVVYSYHVLRYRLQNGLSPEFLTYAINSAPVRAYFSSVCTGTTRMVLSREDFKGAWVALPSLEEQTAIATFLDRETGKIDALIAEQEKLLTLLTEKRQATISHAVTKGLNPDAPMRDSGVEWLGEVPEHWDVRRLKGISPQITVGIVVEPSKYYCDEGVPALRSLNVAPGRVTSENLVFISAEANEQLQKSRLAAGDLVAVRSGQVGITAVVPQELDGCNCIDLIIIRKPLEDCEQFLCWFLGSDPAKQQFSEGSGGAIQQHFNIGMAMNLVIPRPPASEQRLIASFLAAEAAHLDALTTEATRAIDLLKERRTALISAAVTGKIDVRHLANQEAA